MTTFGAPLFAAYLAAYTAALCVVVCTQLMVLMTQLSGSVWFAAFRHHSAVVLRSMPVLALFAAPLLLYPRPHHAAFAVRGVAYLAIWLATGEWLLRTAPESRPVSLRIGALVASFAALNGAAFEWMMSVSPGWSSTAYGIYVFAGGTTASLALLALLAGSDRDGSNPLPPRTDHFQALGRLWLAFVLFWAYIWYSQYFIIWIAGIPAEVSWVSVRFTGAWGVLGRTIVVTAFVIPFLVLVFRAARGSRRLMIGLGAWVLVVHYADVFWLLVPSLRPRSSVGDVILDVIAALLVVLWAGAGARWRRDMAPVVSVDALSIDAAARYEAH